MSGDKTIEGLEFRCTCSGCPEQYDVYKEDVQVAYVRERGGSCRIDMPDHEGNTVHRCSDDEMDFDVFAAIINTKLNKKPTKSDEEEGLCVDDFDYDEDFYIKCNGKTILGVYDKGNLGYDVNKERPLELMFVIPEKLPKGYHLELGRGYCEEQVLKLVKD